MSMAGLMRFRRGGLSRRRKNGKRAADPWSATNADRGGDAARHNAHMRDRDGSRKRLDAGVSLQAVPSVRRPGADQRWEGRGLIPCRRQASSVVSPASRSRKTPMTRACAGLLHLAPVSPDGGLAVKTRDREGGRSCASPSGAGTERVTFLGRSHPSASPGDEGGLGCRRRKFLSSATRAALR